MKRIQLKRAMQHPKTKANMRPGFHNLEDDVFSHWMVQGLIKTGDIIVVDNVTSKPPVLQPAKSLRRVLSPTGVKVEEILPQKPSVSAEAKKEDESESKSEIKGENTEKAISGAERKVSPLLQQQQQQQSQPDSESKKEDGEESKDTTEDEKVKKIKRVKKEKK